MAFFGLKVSKKAMTYLTVHILRVRSWLSTKKHTNAARDNKHCASYLYMSQISIGLFPAFWPLCECHASRNLYYRQSGGLSREAFSWSMCGSGIYYHCNQHRQRHYLPVHRNQVRLHTQSYLSRADLKLTYLLLIPASATWTAPQITLRIASGRSVCKCMQTSLFFYRS